MEWTIAIFLIRLWSIINFIINKNGSAVDDDIHVVIILPDLSTEYTIQRSIKKYLFYESKSATQKNNYSSSSSATSSVL